MTILEERPLHDLADAREALADEWRAASPQTAEQISAFYQHAQGQTADLNAWHEHTERKIWMNMLVHVARESKARVVVDIGCGAGHDLRALRTAGVPELYGIEPNVRQRRDLLADGFDCGPSLDQAPIEQADLLNCIDVLEHIPDPEAFLAQVASRARLGALLFEATATHDHGTPLHLQANWGWHPGRCLEQLGWRLIDENGRVHVWRRETQVGAQTASLLLCAYRGVAPDTMQAIITLMAGDQRIWRFKAKTGDSLIARSRSIIVTNWWNSCGDDVFLMVDDDVVWAQADADRAVELCRNGYDIVCGAYPTHNGESVACRFMAGTEDMQFGPGLMPVEIEYAATGFMAVHRQVIDAMVKTLPLCHAQEEWGFYPLFQSMPVEDPRIGWMFLSEDWGFSRMARELGFKVWLDRQARLLHTGTIPVSLMNREAVHDAIGKA